jgi:phage-related protein
MAEGGKPLVWLHGQVKTPPLSKDARRTAGFLLRILQLGSLLSMPNSRPMPSIGPRCHELRINDTARHLTWRIIYRIDHDAILIGDVFAKKPRQTPASGINSCIRRFRLYDDTVKRRTS